MREDEDEAVAGDPRPLGRPRGHGFRTVVRWNGAWIVVSLGYALASWVLAAALGISDPRMPGVPALREGARASLIIGGAAALSFLYWHFVITPVRLRVRAGSSPFEGHPIRPIRNPVLRLANLAIVLISLAVFMDAFAIFKAAIPLIHPFGLDGALHAVDVVLHLGVEPWRLTHVLAPGPVATRVLDMVYVSWIPVSVGVLVVAALSLEPVWRKRFLLSFLAVWIIVGTLLATAFSSAGPCFARYIPDAPSYSGLMDRLYQQHQVVELTSLAIQESLWSNHLSGSPAALRGISAMPSVHVALSVLCWLAIRARSRPWGWLAGAYALLMFVATVHLGWHYAVDGYVAAAVTAGLWWAGGRLPRAELRV